MIENSPTVIDSHRHVVGPKLRQKFVENGGLDDSSPLPQVTDNEVFFYREFVDMEYSMEVQRAGGVTMSIISQGGEVEMFAQQIIKREVTESLKFLNDEAMEIRERYPRDITCMANAHALEENSRSVIDPMITDEGACAISISTSYGSGAQQVFLDSPKAEWLWEYAQAKDLLVHIHPPMGSVGDISMKQYRLIEAVGRPFDTALTAARMIYSGLFDKYPKLKVAFVHMGGALAPVVCRLDWNWNLNYKGINNPPLNKVAKNLMQPSGYFKSNIYVDSMGPSALGLRAAVELCGVDRVLFGTDFGPVPISPRAHIDLVNEVFRDAEDRDAIFSENARRLFQLADYAASTYSDPRKGGMGTVLQEVQR